MRSVSTAALTMQMPASPSPWSAARRRHERAAHRQADGDDGVVLGGELVVRALDRGDPVGPRDLVEVLPARAVAGQQRHLDGVPARGEVLGPRPHRHRVAGETVLDQHADAAPAGELGPRRRGHRSDEGGVEGGRRGTAERDLHAHSVHHRRWSRLARGTPAGTVRVSTPGDESRTELAWREIVENYGERPRSTTSATHVVRAPAGAGAGRATSTTSRRRGRRRPGRRAVPPASPAAVPDPPHLAARRRLGRHLRRARARAADRPALRSTSRRSSAGRWSAWFVGGFVYLVVDDAARRRATPGTTARASERRVGVRRCRQRRVARRERERDRRGHRPPDGQRHPVAASSTTSASTAATTSSTSSTSATRPHDPSSATITVQAEDDESLQRLLMRLQTRGVNQVDPGEAVDRRGRAGRRAPRRLLLHHQPRDPRPPRRHAGTTSRTPRWTAAWSSTESPDGALRVRTLPMSDVRGRHAHRDRRLRHPGRRSRARRGRRGSFASWSPTSPPRSRRRCSCARSPTACARPRPPARSVLWVGGPGVVHTGAAPAMVALVDAGFVDVLFAGNALATHDIESSLYGTSLGRRPEPWARASSTATSTTSARSTRSARRARSRAAVDDGVLTGGIMHALVTHEKRFVLVGSVRDDGPLPDVYTDVHRGPARDARRDRRRRLLPDGRDHAALGRDRQHPARVGPAGVRRHQPEPRSPSSPTAAPPRRRGIVTDVGLFLEQLALELVPDYRRG